MKSATHNFGKHYQHFLKWQQRTREPGLTALLFIEGTLSVRRHAARRHGLAAGFRPADNVHAVRSGDFGRDVAQSFCGCDCRCFRIVISTTSIIIHAEYPSIITEWLSAGGRMLGIGTLSVVIARAVFGPGHVTLHRVQGAIVLYMNFALFFFIAYQLIDHVVANAFVGLPKAARNTVPARRCSILASGH